ncbi:MAG TPA: hypothetical protein VNA25_15655, partial [Phycisphaerae bacterium]|nr:hypothetical protein [Phycisphaerae bacterium]
MTRTSWTIGLAVVFAVLQHAAADDVAYQLSYTENCTFYISNLQTGAQTPVGPTGVRYIDHLAVSPKDGTPYGLSYSGDLYTINVSTAVATLEANDTLPDGSVGGLAFAPDGTLYAALRAGSLAGKFYAINIGTGGATEVGALHPYVSTRALAIDNAGRCIGWDGGAKWLFEANLADASTQSLGYLETPFEAFDYAPDGTLYGSNAGGALYVVDANQITATYIRQLGTASGVYAFAIVP